MGDDLVSVSDYAAELGITKQAVSKQLKRYADAGAVSVTKRGRASLFSRAEFEGAKAEHGEPDRELAVEMAFSRPLPRTPTAGQEVDPYRHAAGQEKAARARRAELELGQLEGRLVERDSVEQEHIALSRRVRSVVLMTCSVAADRVSALPNPSDGRAVKAVLTDQFRKALASLADSLGGDGEQGQA